MYIFALSHNLSKKIENRNFFCLFFYLKNRNEYEKMNEWIWFCAHVYVSLSLPLSLCMCKYKNVKFVIRFRFSFTKEENAIKIQFIFSDRTNCNLLLFNLHHVHLIWFHCEFYFFTSSRFDFFSVQFFIRMLMVVKMVCVFKKNCRFELFFSPLYLLYLYHDKFIHAFSIFIFPVQKYIYIYVYIVQSSIKFLKCYQNAFKMCFHKIWILIDFSWLKKLLHVSFFCCCCCWCSSYFLFTYYFGLVYINKHERIRVYKPQKLIYTVKLFQYTTMFNNKRTFCLVAYFIKNFDFFSFYSFWITIPLYISCELEKKSTIKLWIYVVLTALQQQNKKKSTKK